MLSKESYIKDVDFGYLEKRLVDREQWSRQDAKEAVRRYKNFLILLCKYPDRQLAPAPDIDEVWHAHILFTFEYIRDCNAIFGGYLHHTPSQDSGSRGRKIMEEAQHRTADLYVREFKESYFLELDVSALW